MAGASRPRKAPSRTLQRAQGALSIRRWSHQLDPAPPSRLVSPRVASIEAGHPLPLPEMFFGANTLRMQHKESGFAMEFSAVDAFANARTVPPDDSVKIHAAKTWKCR